MEKYAEKASEGEFDRDDQTKFFQTHQKDHANEFVQPDLEQNLNIFQEDDNL